MSIKGLKKDMVYLIADMVMNTWRGVEGVNSLGALYIVMEISLRRNIYHPRARLPSTKSDFVLNLPKQETERSFSPKNMKKNEKKN